MTTAVALFLLAAMSPDIPSEVVAGMHANLTPATSEWTMGDRTRFTVRLWYDPPPGGTPSMNLDLDNGTWRFVFTSAGTDTSRTRAPYTFAGPPVVSDNVVAIHSAWSRTDDVIVPLLAPDGDQIPPGRYSVRAVYTNLTPADAPQAHPDTPLPLWSGTLSSPSVDVTVLPARPAPVAVTVPAGVTFDAGDNGTGWRWSGATRPVGVTPRPGYVVAVHWTMVVRGGGGDVVHESSGDHPAGDWPDTRVRLRPDVPKPGAGERLTYRVTLEVFETSVLPGHMWNPRAGDYHVLWHDTLEGTVP